MRKVKLTLKKAKAIAKMVIGTDKGVVLTGNYGEFQYYEIEMGLIRAVITNNSGYNEITQIRIFTSCGTGTFQLHFNTITLERDYYITEVELEKEREEMLEEKAPCNTKIILRAMAREFDSDELREKVEKAILENQ